MTSRVHTAFRLEQELLDEIDDVAARMKKFLRGVDIKRSAVIRMLILRGLDDFKRTGP
jgi:hypothetical protein